MPSVDNRIVEMRFDNKDFESGVKTSLGTLDKLKSALSFKNITSGLDDIQKAFGKIDFSSAEKAIDAVADHFTAFGRIGDQVLRRIGDKVVDLGEQVIKLTKSLTLDQVGAGWTKLNQKTQSVQTIMNATGLSIDDVNQKLDRLMWYSDETSFGFTDMTSALETMTAKGGDIEKLIPMLMGFGNAVAYSGKSSSEFQRVLRYGLSQAYSLGYLGTRDWYSFTTAGVGSSQLQKLLLKWSNELEGTSYDFGEGFASAFSEALTKKSFTNRVMENAFGEFAEMTLEAERLIAEGVYDNATEAYRELSSQFDDFRGKAAKAAQQAKSFYEVIAAVKDAVSTGWMVSFEHIFGNLNEQIELWSWLVEEFLEVFAYGAEDRNNLLKQWHDGIDAIDHDTFVFLRNQAILTGTQDEFFKSVKKGVYHISGYELAIESLHNVWYAFKDILYAVKEAWNNVFPPITVERLIGITERVRDATASFREMFTFIEKKTDAVKSIFSDTTEEVEATTETIDELAERVISGEFGNGDVRFAAIEALGYSWKTVQNRVNELLGSSYRYETTAEEEAGVIDNLASSTSNAAEATDFLIETVRESSTPIKIIQKIVSTLGETFRLVWKAGKDVFTEIKNGFTSVISVPTIKDILSVILQIAETIHDKIDNFIKRARYAGALKTIRTVVQRITEAIVGVWNILKRIFSSAKSGWQKVFPVTTASTFLRIVNSIVDGVTSFVSTISSHLAESGAYEHIKNIVSGIAAVLDIILQFGYAIWDIILKPLFSADNTASALQTILEFLGNIGLTLSDIARKWRENNTIPKKLQSIVDTIKGGWSSITRFASTLRELFGPIFSRGLIVLRIIGGALKDFFAGIKDSKWISTIHEFFVTLFDDFSLLDGFSSIVHGVVDAIRILLDAFIGGFSGIDGGGIDALLNSAFIGFGASSIASSITRIATTVEKKTEKFNLGEIIKNALSLDTLADVFSGLKTTFSGTESIAKSAWTLAKAIGVISVSLILLSGVDADKLMTSVIIIGSVMAIITHVIKTLGSSLQMIDSSVLDKMKGFKASITSLVAAFSASFNLTILGTTMIKMASAVLLLAHAIKKLSGISNVITPTLLVMGLMYMIYRMMLSFASIKDISGLREFAHSFAIVSIGIRILASSVAVFADLASNDITGFIVGLAGVISVLLLLFGMMKGIAGLNVADALTATNAMKGFATSFIGMAVAIDIMAPAVALFSLIPFEKLAVGIVGIGSLLYIVQQFLSSTSAINGKHALGVAVVVSSIASSLVIIAAAIRLLSTGSIDQVIVSTMALTALLVVIGYLLEKSGEVSAKHALAFAGALAAIASALFIFAAGVALLSKAPWYIIVIAVAALVGGFAAMVAITGKIGEVVISKFFKLSGSFVLLGAGLLAFGAGLAIVTAGLPAFAVSLITSATILAKGIGTVVGALATAGVQIFGSIAYLLSGLIDALVEAIEASVPKIVEGVFTVLISIVKALIDFAPVLLSLVSYLIFDILLPWIARMIPTLVNDLLILVVTIINSLTIAILNNSTAIGLALGNLVKGLIFAVLNILGGFLGGLFGTKNFFNIVPDNIVSDIESQNRSLTGALQGSGVDISAAGKSFLSSSEQAASDITKGKEEVASAAKNPVTIPSQVITQAEDSNSGVTSGGETEESLDEEYHRLQRASADYYASRNEELESLKAEQKALQGLVEEEGLSTSKKDSLRARIEEIQKTIDELEDASNIPNEVYRYGAIREQYELSQLQKEKQRILDQLEDDTISEAKKDNLRRRLEELVDVELPDEGESTTAAYNSGMGVVDQLASGLGDGFDNLDVGSLMGEFGGNFTDYLGNVGLDAKTTFVNNSELTEEDKSRILGSYEGLLPKDEEPEPETPWYEEKDPWGALSDREQEQWTQSQEYADIQKERDTLVAWLNSPDALPYGESYIQQVQDRIDVLDGILGKEEHKMSEWARETANIWGSDVSEASFSQESPGYKAQEASLEAKTQALQEERQRLYEWLTSPTMQEYANSSDPFLQNYVDGIQSRIAEINDELSGVEVPEDYFLTELASLYNKAVETNEDSDWAAVGDMIQDGLERGIIRSSYEAIDALEMTGSEMVRLFSNKMGIASPSKVMAEQGRYVDEGLALGINQHSGVVRSPIQRVIGSMISIIRSARDKFYNVGVYLMKGLAQGITDTQGEVEIATRKVVRASITAAEQESNENSPSKEFARIGMYSGLGYAQGLLSMSGEAEDAARNMVLASMNGTKDALRLITSAIESDVEMDPTIRPVLDLSNLRYGAAQASSLMSRTFSTKLGYAAASMAGGEFRGAKASLASARTDRINNYNSNFRELRADIHELKDAMNEMQIVMDTGALVGSIQKPMDRALGRGMQYSNRRL